MFEKLKGALARFAERHLDGSLTFGPLTLYGANAMAWAVNLRVRALGVTLCAKPPGRRGWYFYASPNGTPWAAVLGCGPGFGRENGERVAQRLDVIEVSPRPADEAARLWALWGPEPQASGTAPGRGGEGGGQGDIFDPATGMFVGPGTRLAPDDPRADANPMRVPLRRFTVPIGDA